MCRSVLEEVIEKQFGRLGIDPVAELGKDGCTLGALLGLVKHPDLRSSNIVPAEAWREVDTVTIGKQGCSWRIPSGKECTRLRHALKACSGVYPKVRIDF